MTEHDIKTANIVSRLDKATRMNRLAEIGRSHGFFKRLSASHSALFIEEGETLVVSFDATERVIDRSSDGMPVGFSMVQDGEYSLLTILGARQSWFRDEALFDFFDELTDQGFFDQFDKVLFTGIGPMCGYGALAFSVAAPGAHVLAISPAATLDRDAAPFERRYRGAWRQDFSQRYGYAPDMAQAAEHVTIIYDPVDVMSAAHAALFIAPNTARLKLRHGGMAIGAMLQSADLMNDLWIKASEGPVSAHAFARVSRPARRWFLPYVNRLMAAADQANHPRLALIAARYGQNRSSDGRFDGAVAFFEDRLA